MRNAIIIFFAILMIACTPKQDRQITPQSENTQQEEINTEQDTSSEVKIFRFFYDDNSLTYEYTTVNMLRANLAADTISNLRTVGIYVQNIYYEGSRLIVDLAPIMEQLMDHGSSGSLCNLNNMLYTFSTYPDVTEIKILINGIENIEGSHFGFNTIFQAKDYKDDGR